MARARPNPRLARPLVAESVFELRFPSQRPYAIVPGLLFELLGQDFSEVEELPAAQIPLGMAPAMARHRLKATGGGRLIQVGDGLLSANHTTYVSYDDFRSDIERMLNAAFDLDLVGALTRLGLRYINRAPLDRSWHEMITYVVEAPERIESSARGRRFQWRSLVSDDIGTLQTVIAWPVQEKGSTAAAMVLDFDCFLEGNFKRSTDQILAWTDGAHDHIYKVFRDSLSEPYLSSLEHEYVTNN
jgi:uncharacterized protein (TIGR04255 family)